MPRKTLLRFLYLTVGVVVLTGLSLPATASAATSSSWTTSRLINWCCREFFEE